MAINNPGNTRPPTLYMTYPADVFFDIETLVNVSQAEKLLILGDRQPTFLDNYAAQKALLNQECQITYLNNAELDQLWQLEHRYDVAIVVGLLEHFDKTKGMQILSRLRDVLSPQYCICLPLNSTGDASQWQLTDLFSFAFSKVASYRQDGVEYGLFKYNINDYKKTPDWLNSDNWANPQMWGKFWW
jgi:hypothetical protein